MNAHTTPAELASCDQRAARSRDRVDRDLVLTERLAINPNDPVDIARLANLAARRACCVIHLADAYARALTRLNAHTPKETNS